MAVSLRLTVGSLKIFRRLRLRRSLRKERMDLRRKARGFPPCAAAKPRRGQYHLRQQVESSVNLRLECLTHPLTRVVLTPSPQTEPPARTQSNPRRRLLFSYCLLPSAFLLSTAHCPLSLRSRRKH